MYVVKGHYVPTCFLFTRALVYTYVVKGHYVPTCFLLTRARIARTLYIYMRNNIMQVKVVNRLVDLISMQVRRMGIQDGTCNVLGVCALLSSSYFCC